MEKLPLRQLFVKSSVVLGTLLLVASCQHIVETNDSAAQPLLSVADAALRISYELETVSVTKLLENSSTPDPLYEVRARPIVNRAMIDLKVLGDGSSEWEIKNLEPTFQIPSPQADIPADNSAKTVVTRIANGTAYFYDKDKKLIRTHEMEAPSFSDLLNTLRGGDNPAARIAARVAGGGDVDVNERLDQAKQKGHKVTDLGNGMVAIRAKIDRNTKDSKFDGKEEKFTSVDILDTKTKVIIGTTLYDQKENVVSRLIFKHKFETGVAPQVEMSQHETFGKDERGKAFTTVTTSYYRNMQIESNVTRK